MPNKKTHDAAATIVGAVVGMQLMATEDSLTRILEVMAAVGGAIVGSRLPDLIEPAVHSHHRGVAHALIPAGTVYLALFADSRAVCAQKAGECRTRAQACAIGSRERANHESLCLLWNLTAAALAGFAYGYLSHIALDACTPRGVPLMGRGV